MDKRWHVVAEEKDSWSFGYPFHTLIEACRFAEGLMTAWGNEKTQEKRIRIMLGGLDEQPFLSDLQESVRKEK